MKRRIETAPEWEDLRDKIIGLGESSFKKSYYPQLQARLAELESTVDELRRAEGALRVSERRFREMLEDIRLAAVILDREGRITFCNRFLLELTGRSREEVAGRDWFGTFVSGEIGDELKGCFVEMMRTGKMPQPSVEYTILTRDGEERNISWTCVILHDSAGNVAGVTSIGQDVTERTALEREKEEFYAMLTHDMRAPLTVIQGYSEFILTKEKDGGDEATASAAEIIARNAGRLLRLVDDFMTISRSAAGRLQALPALEDLGALCSAICEDFSGAAQGREVTFSCDTRGALTVRFDKGQVERAVYNLLQNAVEHSRGGSVNLRAGTTERAGKSYAVISVSDTGRGIPREEQGRVFDKYFRLTKGKKGFGLGLAIVKAVAEAHGGFVELESEPGKGCTFRLLLPMDVAA